MKKLILTFAVIALLHSSCTTDFENINTNLNQPEQTNPDLLPERVTPNLLLSNILSTVADRTAMTGWINGNIVSQLTAKLLFSDFDRYNWGSEKVIWSSYYGILPEIELVLKSVQTEANKNTSYEGICLAVRAYIYANLTDNWGDVPVFEAIKGVEGNFKPAYDKQEDIYKQILDDLSTADNLLALGKPITGGDIWYNGDVVKWRKLANSLKLRYLLRISNKQDVSSAMQAVVNNGFIFESNDDNAVMEYPASTRIDSWFVSTQRIGSFDEHRMSQNCERILVQFNDQRMQAWFQPTDNQQDDPNLFVGLPNGLSEDSAGKFNGGTDNISRLNEDFFYRSPNLVKAAVMQFAELQFILAEAVQKGLILGNAETYYNNGVKASFEYWNVTQNTDQYLSQPGVQYDGNLETIITQKWLASFLVGLEGWYDFRRTGLPLFIKPGPGHSNNQNQVPVRFLYPSDEQTLNAENYKAAVSAMGSDNINIKGWWES
ncbi:MAG: SusD/RagB family nutrient-binding outer membrane lipoprotein [Tenacibaculum sp.]